MNDDNAYNRVKEETLVWFRNFIELKEQQRTASGPATPKPMEVDGQLDAFQTNLRRVAEHNVRHPTLHVVESIFEVVAQSLEAPDDPKRSPDIVRIIDRVRIGSEPLFMHSAVLFTGGSSVVISRDYRVFNSKREQIDFVAFDVPGEPKGITWHLTMFLNPLPPSQVRDEIYTLQQTYKVMDFMRPLHQHGCDYLGQGFVQAAVTDIAEIRLCVPQTLGPLVLLPGTPEQLATLNPQVDALTASKKVLADGKEQKGLILDACPPNYRAYVWRAENWKYGRLISAG
jgi:hypothetical protein